MSSIERRAGAFVELDARYDLYLDALDRWIDA
jgi:hypothetical protein